MTAPEQPPAGPAPDATASAASPELQRALRLALDAEPGPSSAVKRAVLGRIRAEQAARRPRLQEQFFAWLSAPIVPRWAPAAALLLIVIQSTALIQLMPGRSTPPAPVTTRALATATTRMRVEFNPQASAQQVRELLGSLGGRIVDGPTPAGTYVVELAAADPKLLGEKLRAARARHDVLLALELAQP